ncbi:gamma-glutamyltransferase [Puniceicoccaceae bacterium K14]|nr:gamma-glutamyltransferase [Puniceicoccaceae bacterium K14]
MKKQIGIVSIFCLLASNPSLLSQIAQEPPIYGSGDSSHPVVGRSGIVSSRDELSTKIGLDILKAGGNAIDAAVAVGFAMAVTTPQAGNLGGGGFMLVHHAETDTTIAIDYREKAPLGATRDMYLDEEGNVDPNKSRYSRMGAGVPGTVAGLAMALEKFGTLTLAEVIQPSINLAENGFPVDYDLYTSLKRGKENIQKLSPEAYSIYYHKDGRPYYPGEILKLPDLAKTLKAIASKGSDAFYKGSIAKLIARDMETNGGLITQKDLALYRPALREPVTGDFNGYQIASMPPPSSGGVHIVQMLNMLEPLDLSEYGHNSAKAIHLMAETMKYAYADRSKHLGDSDFNPVPVDWLVSKEYADSLRDKMNMDAATDSESIMPGTPPIEGPDTTHYNVIDKFGNAVANTYTINFSFGSKILVPGAGFFLNNEMDDFSAKPNVPNAYGLIGGEFNSIESEKRMLSSMTPTIVFKEGAPYLLCGGRGGSRIITAVLQVVLNVLEFDMNVSEAVAAPRVHHQWLPDQLRIEKTINTDTKSILESMGYELKAGFATGYTNAAMFEDGFFYGASDPRLPSGLAEGY